MGFIVFLIFIWICALKLNVIATVLTVIYIVSLEFLFNCFQNIMGLLPNNKFTIVYGGIILFILIFITPIFLISYVNEQETKAKNEIGRESLWKKIKGLSNHPKP